MFIFKKRVLVLLEKLKCWAIILVQDIALFEGSPWLAVVGPAQDAVQLSGMKVGQLRSLERWPKCILIIQTVSPFYVPFESINLSMYSCLCACLTWPCHLSCDVVRHQSTTDKKVERYLTSRPGKTPNHQFKHKNTERCPRNYVPANPSL